MSIENSSIVKIDSWNLGIVVMLDVAAGIQAATYLDRSLSSVH